jgi:hypothetical protein
MGTSQDHLRRHFKDRGKVVLSTEGEPEGATDVEYTTSKENPMEDGEKGIETESEGREVI